MGLVNADKIQAQAKLRKEMDRNKFLHLLSDEEKAKGYIRHYRDAYVHMGEVIDRDTNGNLIGKLFKKGDPGIPTYANQAKQMESMGCVAYIEYPRGHRLAGWYLTEKNLAAIENGDLYRPGGCGKMSRLLPETAEIFAKDHKFYYRAHCQHCNAEFSVEQFVWADTNEIMGS